MFGTSLNFLLLAIPFAILFEALGVNSATFVFSLIALMPLAERLGFVTEELAAHTNDTLGGLLNATFGNATELMICGVSLYNAGSDHDRSYLRIVQLSLLGSILGNLLMVLGTAFLVGGLTTSRQQFNQEGMGVNSGMLIMAVTAILLPSALSETGTDREKGDSELNLSRFESIVLLILYCLYLIFQLVTHKHLYEALEDPLIAEHKTDLENGRDDVNGGKDGPSVPTSYIPQSSQAPPRRSQTFRRTVSGGSPNVDNIIPSATTLHQVRTMVARDEEEEIEEEQVMGLGWALFWLGLITVVIAFLSEMVVSTIKEAHDSLGIPLPFLSTIVLPIVGNAAEHASAIVFAYKNRMEITLGVAVGSATQIAVLVIPFTVVLAWIMGQPLNLDFEWFEAFTLFLCTMITIIAVNDGTSNWIKGLLLVATYVFVSAAFWVHSDKDLSGKD